MCWTQAVSDGLFFTCSHRHWVLGKTRGVCVCIVENTAGIELLIEIWKWILAESQNRCGRKGPVDIIWSPPPPAHAVSDYPGQCLVRFLIFPQVVPQPLWEHYSRVWPPPEVKKKSKAALSCIDFNGLVCTHWLLSYHWALLRRVECPLLQYLSSGIYTDQ